MRRLSPFPCPHVTLGTISWEKKVHDIVQQHSPTVHKLSVTSEAQSVVAELMPHSEVTCPTLHRWGSLCRGSREGVRTLPITFRKKQNFHLWAEVSRKPLS